LTLVGSAVITIYLAAVCYLFLFQRDYVFKPGGTLTPVAQAGIPALEAVTIDAADGVKLIGWHVQAATGKPTVLYFHGNAGNFSERLPRFKQIAESGFGLLVMSYRGYPGSGGAPSEAALFSDALETFDWLSKRADDIVVHGESLGTGIAAYVAAERDVRALVLEAPYTAALDVAAETYPWVPVPYLMRDPFLTREYIKLVSEPVLIVHGTADRVIPVAHGRRLFEIAGEPKELAIVEGAGHGDLWRRGLWSIVMTFLEEHPRANQAEPEVRRMPSFAG
jgi:fermentation-respiration switch protein FrsA (DUF1100 family)